jgi:DNA-binding transcriptional MerR regulator
MSETTPTTYTLSELSEATGVAARTIRYYIAEDLMPPPVRGGRNASYNADHLAVLKQVLEWQSKGYTLAQIRVFRGGTLVTPSPTPRRCLARRSASTE